MKRGKGNSKKNDFPYLNILDEIPFLLCDLSGPFQSLCKYLFFFTPTVKYKPLKKEEEHIKGFQRANYIVVSTQ